MNRTNPPADPPRPIQLAAIKPPDPTRHEPYRPERRLTGIAVSTDFEFLTRVVDMATMRTKVSIDHHDRSGQPSPGSSWPWAPILAGVAAAGVLLAVAVSLRRRKRPAAGSP